jgi:hypothetical protein
LLLSHEVHCQLHRVHLADERNLQTAKLRLDRVTIVVFVVKIVTSVAETYTPGEHLDYANETRSLTRVRHNDINSAKFFLCPLEESEKIVPFTSVCLLEERSVNRLSWLLEVSNKDFDTSLGQVMDNTLSNSGTATCNDRRFATKLIA